MCCIFFGCRWNDLLPFEDILHIVGLNNATTRFENFMGHVKEIVKKYVFFATERDVLKNFGEAEMHIMDYHFQEIYSLLHQVNPFLVPVVE